MKTPALKKKEETPKASKEEKVSKVAKSEDHQAVEDYGVDFHESMEEENEDRRDSRENLGPKKRVPVADRASKKKEDNDDEDNDASFVGEPIPEEDARERWPHRYSRKTLGLSHALSSLMWLCGPVAGFVVQPIVGSYSDKCRSNFGRRRPYIFTGCLLICLSVIIICFSSDIGVALGDTKEDCSVYRGARWKAAIIFVVGFWILDFANNCVQGPARALMVSMVVVQQMQYLPPGWLLGIS